MLYKIDLIASKKLEKLHFICNRIKLVVNTKNEFDIYNDTKYCVSETIPITGSL